VLPRRIGLLTGNEAAAKRDFVTAVQSRFPAANVVVAQTYVQGQAAPAAIAATLDTLAREPEVDVIVLTRGGGSFEDLLPFSDERVVRAVAACSVPVVSAVGHEQDTPLCDHAADARASTPTAAARLVIPDEHELRERLDAARARLARGAGVTVERARNSLARDRDRLSRAPALLVERKRAGLEALAGRLQTLSPQRTLARGYAIVRTDNGIVRSSSELAVGARVEVELGEGGFGGRVEETRP
jgi:exodeoxyribonuclease VII large subunit